MMDSVGLPAANARPHLICLRRPGELQGSDLAETEGKIGLQSLGQVESMMTFVAVHIEVRRILFENHPRQHIATGIAGVFFSGGKP